MAAGFVSFFLIILFGRAYYGNNIGIEYVMSWHARNVVTSVSTFVWNEMFYRTNIELYAPYEIYLMYILNILQVFLYIIENNLNF